MNLKQSRPPWIVFVTIILIIAAILIFAAIQSAPI